MPKKASRRKTTRRPKASPFKPSPVLAWSLICFAVSLVALGVIVGVNDLAASL